MGRHFNFALRATGVTASGETLLDPGTATDRLKVHGWLAARRLGHFWSNSISNGRRSNDTRAVALLSLPRSGTTYICDLLDFHPQIQSHLEIFHQDKVFLRDPAGALSKVNRNLDTSFSSPEDQRLIEFAHRQPHDFIRALAPRTRGQFLSFKVFNGHLNPGPLYDSVLANGSVAKIIFKRDVLDSYVSLKKARLANSWESVDTTDMKVELDAARFAAYVKSVDNWYGFVERCLVNADQSWSVLNYEDVLKQDTDYDRLSHVVDALRDTSVDIRSLPECDVPEVSVARRRQDKSPSTADKILNVDKFMSDLMKLGMAPVVERLRLCWMGWFGWLGLLAV